MPNKNIYRTCLSQYSSSRIIDLPKENSPTSGCLVSGDQYHSSIRDFCEFIWNYGDIGLQTPSGNLYIDGVNVGEYEYQKHTGATYTYSSSSEIGSASENKILFLVARSITISGNGTVLKPNNSSNNSKNMLVIYSHTGITATGTSAKIQNKAANNQFNDNIKIINGTIPNYMGIITYAMHPRLTTNYHPATQGTPVSSSYLVTLYGNVGFPTDQYLSSNDGLLFGGNGSSGGSLSVDNATAQGSYGNLRKCFRRWRRWRWSS
jgi:hypothetical protein